MLATIVNAVFAVCFLLYCHYVDGPVTKALKEELKEYKEVN
jgi:hypothetical protein